MFSRIVCGGFALFFSTNGRIFRASRHALGKDAEVLVLQMFYRHILNHRSTPIPELGVPTPRLSEKPHH